MCSFIIEYGSNENLVSSKMVEKVKFPKSPIHVSWLTKGQQTLVNEQACVNFSIA